MARRKTTAKQAVNSGQGGEPINDDAANGFDQLPLPLVVRDRETGKFVKLSDRAGRGER